MRGTPVSENNTRSFITRRMKGKNTNRVGIQLAQEILKTFIQVAKAINLNILPFSPLPDTLKNES